jgi:hypothetical protein
VVVSAIVGTVTVSLAARGKQLVTKTETTRSRRIVRLSRGILLNRVHLPIVEFGDNDIIRVEHVQL